VEKDSSAAAWKTAVSAFLVGQGFNEILTNSITNSAYYTPEELESVVKMVNNLSAELNIMRPSLLETGLESVAHNLNRKNTNLQFFEFGKTYHTSGVGQYSEEQHLALWITGQLREDGWKGKGPNADFYYIKTLCQRIFQLVGLTLPAWEPLQSPRLPTGLSISVNGDIIVEAGMVSPSVLKQFDCKQDLYFADVRWQKLLALTSGKDVEFRELPKQLPVQRDLAMIVESSLTFEKVEKAIQGARVGKLQDIKLFDIFQSEKLGKDKKSLAVSFTFLDEEKTLTDKEIDGMVGRIMDVLEKDLQAEIRK
jgi:phenylalanyl-tRNA synthetase beta chain